MPIRVTYYQPLAHLVRQKSFYNVVFISFKILRRVASWVESVKIPASKMAAINRVQYHPPPPISFCGGPRIIQKLIDVVIKILELPLYIPPSLDRITVQQGTSYSITEWSLPTDRAFEQGYTVLAHLHLEAILRFSYALVNPWCCFCS
jgi:hypothetical protein